MPASDQGRCKMESFLQAGWYLLKTKTHQESVAFANLENQGFDAYNPKVRVRKSKGILKEEALFPGYLFLSLDLRDLGRYHKIRSTRGVTEMVFFNRVTRELYKDGRLSKEAMRDSDSLMPKPIPNGEEIIETIRQIAQTLNDEAEGKTAPPSKGRFSQGDKVIMNNPLYKNLRMTFMHNLGSQRGAILVQHIKEQRLPCGETTCEVVSEQTMEVKLDDLEKA